MNLFDVRGSAASTLFLRAQAMGPREVIQRVARRTSAVIASRYDTAGLDFPLLPQDVADSTRLSADRPARGATGEGLRVAWLCTPPGPGSGGHTTLFRLIRGLEQRGHHCTVLLYDVHKGNLINHRNVIRTGWPALAADIEAVPEKLSGFDAYVASSWDTAHVLATRRDPEAPSAAYYFIQDFEPFFYPRGSLYALAEDSYRFGFTHLALGPMVAATLRREVGVDAHVISFGSDQTSYSRVNDHNRSGVVFFARPLVDRRGYQLGRLALQEFHKLHPEQEIHIYGSRVSGWDIPITQHGTLSSRELNELYNQTISGLALSFTNVTLVASEMLAAGNLAVLNDHEFARSVLTNPEAVWASATPSSLASALSAVVTDPQRTARSRRAAKVSGKSWATSQGEVASIMTEVSACSH